MSELEEVTQSSWESAVINSELPVLVDFWGPQCPPCRALAPTLEVVATEMAGKAKIVKVNVQDEMPLAAKYGVTMIPALFIFKGGRIVEQWMGNQPKQRIIERLNQHL